MQGKGAEEKSCCHTVAQHPGTNPCLNLREWYRRLSLEEVDPDFSSAPCCPRSPAKNKESIREHSDTETYPWVPMESMKRCQREKGALATPPPAQPS